MIIESDGICVVGRLCAWLSLNRDYDHSFLLSDPSSHSASSREEKKPQSSSPRRRRDKHRDRERKEGDWEKTRGSDSDRRVDLC